MKGNSTRSAAVDQEEVVSDSTNDWHKQWGSWTDESHEGQHIAFAMSVAQQLYA